jgi:phosphoglycerol transferase MdoB-like AlkP superfamily enzyme
MRFIEFLIVPIYLAYGALTYLGFNALGSSETSIVLMIITIVVMFFVCIIFHSISETSLDTDFSDYESYALEWHKLTVGLAFVLFVTLPVLLITGMIRWAFAWLNT